MECLQEYLLFKYLHIDDNKMICVRFLCEHTISPARSRRIYKPHWIIKCGKSLVLFITRIEDDRQNLLFKDVFVCPPAYVTNANLFYVTKTNNKLEKFHWVFNFVYGMCQRIISQWMSLCRPQFI